MDLPFERSLADAVAFLRDLPRQREAVPGAPDGRSASLAPPPGLRAALLVDPPPASPRVDYDLLFGAPEGGTVSLNWRADGGVPWVVEYADHWAANHVVTVNDHPVTVQ